MRPEAIQHSVFSVAEGLQRILKCNVSAQVVQCCRRSAPMAFSPHELVEVRRQHLLVNSLHPFELSFHSIPIGLAILDVLTKNSPADYEGSSLLGTDDLDTAIYTDTCYYLLAYFMSGIFCLFQY